MILESKRVLVTGGTGSLGKVLVRRILTEALGRPEKVVVFSRDEAKQHEMRVSYMHKKVTTDEVIYRNFMDILQFRIGDVRDYASVSMALRDADIVVNAAALKQVPTCEYFPGEAVLTNIIGAVNITRAILEQDLPVETVVGVSTDKAVKPINVMGMTKALQERVFVASNLFSKKTRFTCVRYGNVLASRGSVIPLFIEQIRNGGPVTVTLPHMTRFLLNLEQAVDVVFAALEHGNSGEIFVPIVPAATVEDIARALIGERDIAVQTLGIRPGEKIHEVLISEEEINHTVQRGRYYVILPMLPELQTGAETTPVLDREYSSADSVIGLEATIRLMAENNLTADGQILLAEGNELLR